MASVSVASLIEMGLTAAAAGAGAYESVQRGNAQANADKARARQATLQANQQQINMRQNMLRALAAQNAGTLGAIGTGGATSFAANARRQINQNQNDLAISNANKSAQVSLLDQAAANASGAGTIGGITDLARGGAQVATIYKSAQGG